MKITLTVSLITDKISIGYPSIRFGCFLRKDTTLSFTRKVSYAES